MLKTTGSFSSFSVDDMAKAKKFYADVLGLDIEVQKGMGLKLPLPGGGEGFIYEKKDHKPATFTVLNFVVDDIKEAVKELKALGVTLERYEGMHQDEDGIARGIAQKMGPDIAWFKDPAGNILSVLEKGE